MAAIVRSESGSVHLSWRRELARLDQAAALRMLTGVARGGAGMRDLRRLLSEDGGEAGVERMDDDAVLETLAAKIAAGHLVAFTQRSAGGVWAERVETAPPPPTEFAAPPIDTATTWVEFQLVGEDGKPVPGQRYEVTLPDGTTKEGRLNSQGRVRIGDISEPGSCTFSFPDLDQDAWVEA